MPMKFNHRASLVLLLAIGLLFVLSACNLGAPSNDDQGEATLTTAAELTVQPTTTSLAQGGVTVFPTFTPFAFSTRPPNPTAIVIVPNNPPPPTNTPAPISIVIVSPLPGNIVSGTVQVVGSASHPNFLQYRLEYAPQNNPNNQWLPITGIVQQPTVAGVLGVWSTNTGATPDGVYQLRLRVFLRDGTQQTTLVGNVRVQNQQATPVPTNTTVPRPIAAFTQNLTTGTAPLVVNFTSQAQGQITRHSWSFGDGGSSSIVNPTYTYRTPGTYTVTLAVTGPGGTSNVSRQITVNSPAAPVAAFTASTVSGEPPLTVDFTNGSTGQINTIEWDFGDGSTSTEQNPTHIFNDPGTYNVILTVTGNGGSSSLIRQITVEDNTVEAPTASFNASATEIETGDTVTFTNTTTGESTSFLWDFNGDGITDNTDISPTHTYNSAGTYDVRLTAIGAGGQSDAVVTITVSDPPDAPSASFDVSVDNNIAPVVASFTNTTTGDATSYEWDFGDGRTSTEENPQITYDAAGTYLVTLTATGDGGSTTSEEVAINVETPLEAPTADFTADTQSGTVELTVNFSNASNGSQLSYLWDFGDGSATVSDENPTHVFTSTGSFTVTMTVTDPQNQSDSATMQIDVSEEVVIAPPVPAFIFAPATGTVNQDIAFTNQTTGDATSYEWDFGDGSTSTEVSPAHAYATSGTFTVTLTATNSGGSQSTTQDILVNDAAPAPEPGFSVSSNPAEVDQDITFTNDSLNADSYEWDFGDGSPVVTDVDPVHAYTASGTYTVTLSATGEGGTSSATQQIIINDVAIPAPVANFAVDVASGTVPLTVTFTDLSTDADTYSWDFNGDGVEDATGAGPHQFVYDVAAQYTASLTVSNGSGTSAPFTTQIDAQAVAVPLPVANFAVDVASGTVPLTVTFTDLSTDADTYSWDFNGDGVEDATGAGPHQFVYDVAAQYTASLTVSNGSGTSAPFTTQIDAQAVAVPLPVANFAVDVASGTVPLTVTFTDLSTDADTYSWDFNGDGVEDATGAGPHQFVYDVAAQYTASLTVSNGSGTSAPFTTQIDAQEEQVSAPTGALVYISNEPGNLDIFVAEANGSNPVNITNTAFNEVEPAWSPDGTKIAYASDEFGDYDIFVFDLNTMSSTQITTSGANDRQPAWSPDGSQLAFASDRNNLNVNNDVFVVNVSNLGAGSFSPTVLLSTPADEQQPTWSPDGSQIAYMSDAAGDGTNNIYVANVADPSTPVQITTSPETANTSNQPEWSGNNVIVFSADPDANGNREIFTINPDGSNQVRLTTNGANDRIPYWSPDNSKIYYTSNLATDGSGRTIDLNIWSMNPDGSGQSAVTTSGSDEANGNTR